MAEATAQSDQATILPNLGDNAWVIDVLSQTTAERHVAENRKDEDRKIKRESNNYGRAFEKAILKTNKEHESFFSEMFSNLSDTFKNALNLTKNNKSETGFPKTGGKVKSETDVILNNLGSSIDLLAESSWYKDSYMNKMVQSLSDYLYNGSKEKDPSRDKKKEKTEWWITKQFVTLFKSKWFKNTLEYLGDMVESAGGWLMDLIKFFMVLAIFDPGGKFFTMIVNFLVSLVGMLINMISAILPKIISALPGLLQTVTGALINAIQVLVPAIVKLIPLFVKAIVTAATSILNMLPQIFTVLMDSLKTLFTGDFLNQIISSIVQGITSFIGVLVKIIPMLIQTLVEVVPTIILAIVSQVPTILRALLDGFILLFPILVKAFFDIIIAIVEMLPQIFEMLIPMLPEIIVALISAIVVSIPVLMQAFARLIPALDKAIYVLVDELVKAFSVLGGMFSDILGEAVMNLFNYFDDLTMGWQISITEFFTKFFKKTIPNLIYSAVSSISNTLKRAFSWFTSLFNNPIINSVVDSIKGIFTALSTFGKWAVSGAGNAISKIFESISDFFSYIGNFLGTLFSGLATGKILSGDFRESVGTIASAQTFEGSAKSPLESAFAKKIVSVAEKSSFDQKALTDSISDALRDGLISKEESEKLKAETSGLKNKDLAGQNRLLEALIQAVKDNREKRGSKMSVPNSGSSTD